MGSFISDGTSLLLILKSISQFADSFLSQTKTELSFSFPVYTDGTIAGFELKCHLYFCEFLKWFLHVNFAFSNISFRWCFVFYAMYSKRKKRCKHLCHVDLS